jgi:nicotinamidase-related amidase
MTALVGRPNTALLVVDVQQLILPDLWHGPEVVARIGALVDRARAEGTPMVWIQHEGPGIQRGSKGWQIVAELCPADGEPVVAKRFRSSFEETELDAVLARLAVGRLVVCGAQSDFCVRHTVHAALERGYDVVLVADAHTTEDAEIDGVRIPAELIVAHQNRATRGYALPGRTSDIALHDEVRLG